jgi:hypothetical protein
VAAVATAVSVLTIHDDVFNDRPLINVATDVDRPYAVTIAVDAVNAIVDDAPAVATPAFKRFITEDWCVCLK